MNKNPIFNRLKFNSRAAIPLSSFQKVALENFHRKLDEKQYSYEEVPCLCGATETILIAQKDRYGLSVDTQLCKQCGMMRTSPRLDEHSLEKFYREDYRSIYVGSPQASDDFFEEQVKSGRRIYKFVSSKFKSQKNLTVFEIGCGAGGILLPFKEQQWLTYGCDLGSEYLSRGRQEGLILENGNEESLRQYGKADLIILSHVLEHFSNPVKSLQSITDLLNPNGLIYIEVPGIFRIHATYGDFLLFLQNAHLYHFTLETLTFLMDQVGFELVEGDEWIKSIYRKKTDETSKLIGH